MSNLCPSKLRKNNVHILTIKITPIKVSGNNVDFSTIEITSKKVRGNHVDFWTSEITSKKVRGNHVNFSTIEITSKIVHGNHVDFSTRKFVEIWSSTYRPNIHVESTWIRRGVPVGEQIIHRGLLSRLFKDSSQLISTGNKLVGFNI